MPVVSQTMRYPPPWGNRGNRGKRKRVEGFESRMRQYGREQGGLTLTLRGGVPKTQTPPEWWDAKTTNLLTLQHARGCWKYV